MSIEFYVIFFIIVSKKIYMCNMWNLYGLLKKWINDKVVLMLLKLIIFVFEWN